MQLLQERLNRGRFDWSKRYVVQWESRAEVGLSEAVKCQRNWESQDVLFWSSFLATFGVLLPFAKSFQHVCIFFFLSNPSRGKANYSVSCLSESEPSVPLVWRLIGRWTCGARMLHYWSRLFFFPLCGDGVRTSWSSCFCVGFVLFFAQHAVNSHSSHFGTSEYSRLDI